MSAETPVETAELTPPESRSRMRLVLVVGFLLAILLATSAVFLIDGGSAAEAAAAEALKKTGALVVADQSSGHIASVNLSTIETPEALAEAIAQLPALKYATSLDASRTAIKDEHLEAVGKMRALASLALGETGLTDQGVAHLGSLDEIKTLVLASTAITDASMDVIGKLPSLRVVDVSTTKVTQNLTPMAQLPALEWLLIRELTLADGALDKLKGCEKLTHLTITGSKYSEADLNALKKALPQMSVD